MGYYNNFLLFLGLSLILIVTPGPDLIYVLTQGISSGKRAGLISALGVTMGILCTRYLPLNIRVFLWMGWSVFAHEEGHYQMDQCSLRHCPHIPGIQACLYTPRFIIN